LHSENPGRLSRLSVQLASWTIHRLCLGYRKNRATINRTFQALNRRTRAESAQTRNPSTQFRVTAPLFRVRGASLGTLPTRDRHVPAPEPPKIPKSPPRQRVSPAKIVWASASSRRDKENSGVGDYACSRSKLNRFREVREIFFRRFLFLKNSFLDPPGGWVPSRHGSELQISLAAQ